MWQWLLRAKPNISHTIVAGQSLAIYGMHTGLLARILNTDLVVLDDFGLQPPSAQRTPDLYEIISERYERRAIIIASNSDFEEWGGLFRNVLLASAALDRLTHHAQALTIRDASFDSATVARRSGAQ